MEKDDREEGEKNRRIELGRWVRKIHVTLLRSWQSQKVAGDPNAFGDKVPSDADSTSILVFQSCRLSSSLCSRNSDSV